MSLRVIPVGGPGAEDVVVAADGAVYTGTEDGAVYRVDPDGSAVTRVADTGGRPLGIEILGDGRLLVCDARRGMPAVAPASGAVESLLGGMLFCNNAAVASDGTIYVSDSTAIHPIDAWKAEVVEVTRTGRLLRRDPGGGVEVVLDGLAFANGVALAGDESYVAVAETAARTVVRLTLTGPRAGQRDLLVADLPGYPDNIARGSDGLVWVSIASPRTGVIELLQRSPMPVRRLATRLPGRLQPAPKRTVRVEAY